jgi:hypothetical protein
MHLSIEKSESGVSRANPVELQHIFSETPQSDQNEGAIKTLKRLG